MLKWFTNAFSTELPDRMPRYAESGMTVTVGEPKASRWISVDDMKGMGLVGLYEVVEDEKKETE